MDLKQIEPNMDTKTINSLQFLSIFIWFGASLFLLFERNQLKQDWLLKNRGNSFTFTHILFFKKNSMRGRKLDLEARNFL